MFMPLNEGQRALVEKKFEILRQASFGFTQDRLLHIQEEELMGWTGECTGELRRKIASAAPSHIKIALIDFRTLRCISLQCRALPRQYKGVAVLALILLLSLAAPRTVDGEVPTTADFAACNEEAPRAVKAGTASPIKGDHVRAHRARGGAMTTHFADFTGRVIESADPQIHGMEAEGAKNATYQAAYRSCMRRKGF
ncbi:MAG: hypothetical protein ACREJ9_02515 [Candidatus Rokuibacteriota bacterium]